jgi:hypothetical protein
MRSRSPLVNILLGLFLFGFLVWPLLSLFKVAGGPLQRFSLGNATTQGKVLYVGPSKVRSAPAVVGYGYNTPEYPRQPWSFQREQVVAPQDLARFRAGGNVTVEYSLASPGASRIKGYGNTGSVFLDEFGMQFLVLLLLLVLTAVLGFRGRRR